VLPRKQHSKYLNGTHFYAFFAFIAFFANGTHFYAFLAFIALGAAAAAFIALLFAMLLDAGEQEKVPWECKCHSRQASLNQATQELLHYSTQDAMPSMTASLIIT